MKTEPRHGPQNRTDEPGKGPFLLAGIRIDPAALSLDRHGETLRLEAKVMQVLLALVAARGEVVSRAELERTVWAGRIVTDDAVTNTIVKLRKALRDNSRQPRFIETIAKRGYRLKVLPEFEPARPVGTPRGAGLSWQKSVLGTLLLMGVLLGLYLLWPAGEGEDVPAQTSRNQPAIAVMPLQALGDSNKQSYFAEGITLDLITELSRIPELLVISSGTMLGYRQSRADDRTIGLETGVAYLVRGGVQRSGEDLRINVRLIETDRGSTLWAERFEGETQQVFHIQDQVVAGIAQALRQQLGQSFPAPQRDALTRSVAAYDAFLLGQERYGRRTPLDNREAQQHFEHAVRLDPTFARAYAGLALTWSRLAIDGWTDAPEDALAKAYELAQKATDLDPEIAQTHFVLGQVKLFRGQHQQAAAAVSTAIRLNPNYADAYALLAWILHYSGRPGQAIEALEEAHRRNPSSSASYHEITGEIHFSAQRYHEAVAAFERALARNPAHMRARLWLAASHMKLGHEEQASWEISEVLTIHPDFAMSQLPWAFPLKDPRQLEELTETLHLLDLPE